MFGSKHEIRSVYGKWGICLSSALALMRRGFDSQCTNTLDICYGRMELRLLVDGLEVPSTINKFRIRLIRSRFKSLWKSFSFHSYLKGPLSFRLSLLHNFTYLLQASFYFSFPVLQSLSSTFSISSYVFPNLILPFI